MTYLGTTDISMILSQFENLKHLEILLQNNNLKNLAVDKLAISLFLCKNLRFIHFDVARNNINNDALVWCS